MRQFPMREPTWLVMDPAHHTAALKSQQGAVDLFGHHGPPTSTAAFADRDPCSASRGRPLRGGQHLNKLGAQPFAPHALIAFIARR